MPRSCLFIELPSRCSNRLPVELFTLASYCLFVSWGNDSSGSLLALILCFHGGKYPHSTKKNDHRDLLHILPNNLPTPSFEGPDSVRSYFRPTAPSIIARIKGSAPKCTMPCASPPPHLYSPLVSPGTYEPSIIFVFRTSSRCQLWPPITKSHDTLTTTLLSLRRMSLLTTSNYGGES